MPLLTELVTLFVCYYNDVAPTALKNRVVRAVGELCGFEATNLY